MENSYQHLGTFSDWVAAANLQQPLFPLARPGPDTQARVRDVLGFCHQPETPRDVQLDRTWQRDGVQGEEVSWSVGFGPRTYAYVLRPANTHQPLPGVVALHDHSGYKYYGKEKIADGPDGALPAIAPIRAREYENRAYANELAKEGFVVLVHDTFLWGSRRFRFEDIPEDMRRQAAVLLKDNPPDPAVPPEIAAYNAASGLHEHLVAKYCNVLGTSLAGIASYEDRVAFNYLLSRPDVQPDHAGCLGLSGGGNRAALLNATHDQVRAAVIVGLMSTYAGLLDHNMTHTWMFFPFNWARYGDWPDLAACRAPSPLLVQFDLDDTLFTQAGMHAAHERLQGHFSSVGQPQAYTGQFYPGPHKFDLEMQRAAFAWLKQQLSARYLI
jgi:dienelactone hydrolase